jgi:hypothetical protein
MSSKGLDDEMIIKAIESHKVNFEYLSTDNFEDYFIDRTKQIIKCIEKAMGKAVSGLDSEDTIREFGVSLSDKPQPTEGNLMFE